MHQSPPFNCNGITVAAAVSAGIFFIGRELMKQARPLAIVLSLCVFREYDGSR
jgi:hypothetical protein